MSRVGLTCDAADLRLGKRGFLDSELDELGADVGASALDCDLRCSSFTVRRIP